MTSPSVVVEAADWAYLTASAFMLDKGDDVLHPIFTVNTLTQGVSASLPGIIQPYTKLADGTYQPVTTTSKMLVNTGVQTAIWPTGPLPKTGLQDNQSFTVPSGSDAVYFAPLFYGDSALPTQSTENKNLYCTIYLSMDGVGPYKFVFNAALVGGPMTLVMAQSYLQAPMSDNGWSLTQPGGVDNDFVLEYSGSSTQYLPSLTIRKLITDPSFSYIKVSLCTGFGIQMISTFGKVNFQPYTQPNPVSGSSSLVSATPVGMALIIGVPVIVVLAVGLYLGLLLKKRNAQYAALELKIAKPK